MATARRTDVFSGEPQYEPTRKDKLWNPCFAAFASALATVNFGYALGYTAEAEFLQSMFGKKHDAGTYRGDSIKIDHCNGFDIFAVRTECSLLPFKMNFHAGQRERDL